MHRSFKVNYVTFGTGRDEQAFTIASPVAARKPFASFLDTVSGFGVQGGQERAQGTRRAKTAEFVRTTWVLIPDTRDSPKSPGSPHHESLGTQHIAVASANGIAARLSSF
jgi:hypothetical protein